MPSLNRKKRKRLEDAGFRVGDAEDFLGDTQSKESRKPQSAIPVELVEILAQYETLRSRYDAIEKEQSRLEVEKQSLGRELFDLTNAALETFRRKGICAVKIGEKVFLSPDDNLHGIKSVPVVE